MKINKTIAIAVVLFGLLVGGLGAEVFLSQRPVSVNAAPAVQQATTCTDDDANESADCEENEANETNEADESDETSVSPDQLGITPEEAQAAAEAANPGTKTLAVEIDRVNEDGGTLIYEVELDNGIDVKVDANNGKTLGTDVRDAD